VSAVPQPVTRATFRESLLREHPDFPAGRLEAGAWARLDQLALASPLYAQTLLQFPHYCLWLEQPHNLYADFRYQALLDEWHTFATAAGGSLADDEIYLGRLRRWRRLVSLRIAYRSVNGLSSEKNTVRELTLLAEFCLGACHFLAWKRWTARVGQPWDEEENRPARFCVLGLGKLGGGELNFSSDIDLIFFHEGEGWCRRDDGTGVFANAEFFTKVAETLSSMLSAQTADGFLFRVDARLRPDGAHGPLAPALETLENYYASAGQTWERLALLKARPVAGDLALGGELLENLHAFRYPRHPPPSLLAEIAAMKARTEREVTGSAALARDVKSGPGAIREIEFIVQTLQLLHAGRYPFLQTHATDTALDQLARYGLLGREDAQFLQGAYWHLRRVEHRIQMRDEAQTHLLPVDPGELAAIARSLDFSTAAAFQKNLAATRQRVHALYRIFFAGQAGDETFDAWWTFFTTAGVPPAVDAHLRRWFGTEPGAAQALRVFACGDHRHLVNREIVSRFQHLAAGFDAFMPELARPLETLNRLARFAECYGPRRQFFESGAANPQFLRVLALLFDRSTSIHELLCAHPEILEEVLRPEILRKRKGAADLARELAAGPAGADFSRWLWLYTRAEQVRAAIGELLGFLSVEEVEAALSQLADAVLRDALTRVEGGERLLLVALGKYGGAELTLGSDLDLMLLAAEAEAPSAGPAVHALLALLRQDGPLGAAWKLDLRLRPHGEAGPLVATPAALGAYHAPGGGAQFWEKQLLTRARIVAGPVALAEEFRRFADELLYRAPLAADDEHALWAMRERIEHDRDAVVPPGCAFKTGAGGLVDFEFFAQTMQLRHGRAQPPLRQPGTRRVLRELASLGLVAKDDAAALLANYDFLKRIEIMVRRDSGRDTSTLAATPKERALLARWLGFADEAAFWTEHMRRRQETRALVLKLLDSAQT
jgi:glutamate-ammonia-ligase adenylyltransferase